MRVAEAPDAKTLRRLLETVRQPAWRVPSCLRHAVGCDAVACCDAQVVYDAREHDEPLCGASARDVPRRDAQKDAQHVHPMRRPVWRDVHRQAC